VLHFYKDKRKVEPLTIVFIVFVFLLIGSVSYLSYYFYKGKKNADAQEDVNKKIDEIIKDDTKKKGDDLYADIRGQYPEIVGRLKIPYDDQILPVMQHPNDKNDDPYWLQRDANGTVNRNGGGTIFLDYRSQLQKDPNNNSTNLILYGHHMEKLGTMFGKLHEYKKKNFWEKYPIIEFQTMYENDSTNDYTKYEIFVAFDEKVYDENEKTQFEYYNFINAKSEDEFNNAMKYIKGKQFYDTGITPQYGDKLLTLSTCDENAGPDGRFVVMARKKK